MKVTYTIFFANEILFLKQFYFERNQVNIIVFRKEGKMSTLPEIVFEIVRWIGYAAR